MFGDKMKNNKGFMMAEVIIVSAIVLSVITMLFISYNKIYSAYNTRINYNDITTLYRLQYYRNILVENNLMDEILSKNTGQNIVLNIYDGDKTATQNNQFEIPNNEIDNSIVDKVFIARIEQNGDTIGSLQGIIDSTGYKCCRARRKTNHRSD